MEFDYVCNEKEMSAYIFVLNDWYLQKYLLIYDYFNPIELNKNSSPKNKYTNM